MIESLSYIFNPANFEAHGIHFTQTPILFWVLIWGNLLIFIAYQLIPAALLYLVWKRKDIMFTPIFWLFAAFIVLCGIHHLIHVITFWYPIYGIEAVEDWLTGLVSIGTFFAVLYILPLALKLKTPKELDIVNQQLKAANQQLVASEQQLRAANQQMVAANQQLSASEKKVQEKVLELESSNKLMVGRELKMVELKEKIARYEKDGS